MEIIQSNIWIYRDTSRAAALSNSRDTIYRAFSRNISSWSYAMWVALKGRIVMNRLDQSCEVDRPLS